MSIAKMKSPLYKDPVHNGAADPVLIYNVQEEAWWLIYTNRRADIMTDGVEWVHGTDLGIASSKDGGHTWVYQGIIENLDINPGRNTFWAPEVIYYEGTYHMYVSYIIGVPADWNTERHILHYTSKDLWNWHYESTLMLSSNRCIDACVHRLPNGKWGLWYKDETNGSHTYMVESEDLYHFSNPICVIDQYAHEGANVFYYKDYYWLIVDKWKGLGVFRSGNCVDWIECEDILNESGRLKDDAGNGLHADVYVQGDDAYILYFTHPGRASENANSNFYELQRSSIQLRKLSFQKKYLVCNRNEEFEYELKK